MIIAGFLCNGKLKLGGAEKSINKACGIIKTMKILFFIYIMYKKLNFTRTKS